MFAWQCANTPGVTNERYFTRMDSIPHDDTPLKQCTHPDCLQWYPATSEFFYRSKIAIDGLCPRCKVCRRAYSNARYQIPEVRDRMLAYDKVRNRSSKGQAQRKAYRRRPEAMLLCRIRVHNRNAREKSIPGKHTAQDIQLQYKRQKGKCYYCRQTLIKYNVDHVVPVACGGSNDPDNLVVTCPRCNQSKWRKLPHEWPEGGRLL